MTITSRESFLAMGFFTQLVPRCSHHCHWPNCPQTVAPRLWGCKTHWYRLPQNLRDEIWRYYRPGQEVTKRPMPEYLEVAHRVQEWIAQNFPQDVTEGIIIRKL